MRSRPASSATCPPTASPPRSRWPAAAARSASATCWRRPTSRSSSAPPKEVRGIVLPVETAGSTVPTMLFRIPGWVYDLMVVLIVGATAFGQALSDGRHLWLTLPICLLGTIAIFFRRRRGRRGLLRRRDPDGHPHAGARRDRGDRTH